MSRIDSIFILPIAGVFIAMSCIGCKTSTQKDNQFVKTTQKLIVQEGAGIAIQNNAIIDHLMNLQKNLGLLPDAKPVLLARSEIYCHRNDSLKSCFVNISIKEQIKQKSVKAAKQIQLKHTEEIWQFLVQLRPELGDEEKIYAGLTCRAFSQAAPPYKEGQKVCFFQKLRQPHEGYLADEAAYQLAATLKGNQPFLEEEDQVTGSILCDWSQNGGASKCAAHRLHAKGADSYAELSPNIVKESMKIVQMIYATFEPTLITKPQILIPPQQMIAARCTVFAPASKTQKRKAECILVLPM